MSIGFRIFLLLFLVSCASTSSFEDKGGTEIQLELTSQDEAIKQQIVDRVAVFADCKKSSIQAIPDGNTFRLKVAKHFNLKGLDRVFTGRGEIEIRDKSNKVTFFRKDVIEAVDLIRNPNSIQKMITIRLNNQGAKDWAKVTTDNVGKQLYISMDGRYLGAPFVNAPIMGGVLTLPLSEESNVLQYFSILKHNDESLRGTKLLKSDLWLKGEEGLEPLSEELQTRYDSIHHFFARNLDGVHQVVNALSEQLGQNETRSLKQDIVRMSENEIGGYLQLTKLTKSQLSDVLGNAEKLITSSRTVIDMQNIYKDLDKSIEQIMSK